MNKKSMPNRRKNYLINPKFQYRFILATLIPNVASLVLFYVMIDLYFIKLIQDGKDLGLSDDHPYFLLLRDQSLLMNKVFILVAAWTFGPRSLVITNKAAYVVDVDKNTVVTAVDKNNMNENVFTKIDSTLFMM